MRLSSLAAPLLAAAQASAQLVTFDAGNGLNYALSVPESTAKSGSGPIYFQLSGPSSYQWIAMAFGGPEMKGANIFVMYPDSSGKNVTVSPRLGKGNFEPEFNPDTKIELIEGTGIMNGRMVANVMCMNCESWQGGKLDFSSTSQMLLHAFRMGTPPIDSDSEQAELEQHNQNGQPFTFNMVKAQSMASTTTNPFTPQASASAGGNSGSMSEEESDPGDYLLKPHGVIMGLAVAVLFPIGGLLMRVLSFKGLWLFHAAWQLTTACLLTAGFGIGVVMAKDQDQLYSGDAYHHTVLGTCVFAFFWVQPILGILAHWMFTKKHRRNAFSQVHIWFGRSILILGIVNGGLGLSLSDNTTGGEIAYGVVAGVIGLIYIVVTGFVESKKCLGAGRKAQNEKSSASGES